MERIYKFIPFSPTRRISCAKAFNYLYTYNERNNIVYGARTIPSVACVIVYKSSNWSHPYSLESRSYRVTNLDGKRFFPKMCGNSVIGCSLDGSDIGVRLDAYDWEVDYCYLERIEVEEIFSYDGNRPSCP